ncbi:MAG: class I SAM-dependent methyltransferase [Acidimicrobiales bacterium]|jgi:ubiquinone/menaquinone biosynthesis C-methylase UbiE
MIEPLSPPNHHANHPGFSGFAGLLAALSMAFGRKSDARLVVRLSDLGSGDMVVDIGCGPGVAVRYAERQGATVTGIDPAPIMLRVARLQTRRRARVRYIEGVAEALPLQDRSASIVWSIATVHHWGDIDSGLRDVHRVLLPGGRFVAIERQTKPGASGHASHGWSEDQASAFMDRCREHGFVDVHVERSSKGRRSTISVIGRAI